MFVITTACINGLKSVRRNQHLPVPSRATVTAADEYGNPIKRASKPAKAKAPKAAKKKVAAEAQKKSASGPVNQFTFIIYRQKTIGGIGQPLIGQL